MNLETKAITTLTEGYDNFRFWSPARDLVMLSRQQAKGATTRSYTNQAGGTGRETITFREGNDAHRPGSTDGSYHVWASSRLAQGTRSTTHDDTQPYGGW